MSEQQDRLARAQAQLDAARDQIAAHEATISQAHQALADLATAKQQAAAKVASCERVHNQHAQALRDAQAALAIDAGTPGEAEAREQVAAAQAAEAQSREALDAARADHQAKATSDTTKHQAALAEATAKRDEAAQQVAAMERTHQAVHAAAGREAIAEAREHLQALREGVTEARQQLREAKAELDSYHVHVAELAREYPEHAGKRELAEITPGTAHAIREMADDYCGWLESLKRYDGSADVLNVWMSGSYLASLLGDNGLDAQAIHNLLAGAGQRAGVVGLINAIESKLRALVAKAEEHHAAHVAALPPVA